MRLAACTWWQVVAGDLDAPATLAPHLGSVGSVYCHALSGDAASADPAELARGRALAQLLAGRDMRLVVYNSSAGRGSNAGISQVGAPLLLFVTAIDGLSLTG